MEGGKSKKELEELFMQTYIARIQNEATYEEFREVEQSLKDAGYQGHQLFDLMEKALRRRDRQKKEGAMDDRKAKA